MPKSDFLRDEIIDHYLGTGAFTSPTNVFCALHSGPPAGTGANEITGWTVSADRLAVTFGAAAAGVATSNAAIEFQGAPSNGLEVKYFGLWDLAAAGNFLFWGTLSPNVATWTALASTDTYTSYAHGFVNDDRVVVQAFPGSALPTGLAVDTEYWVVGAAADTFQLSATMAGAAIDITTDGEGIAFFVDVTTVNIGDNVSVPSGNITINDDPV